MLLLGCPNCGERSVSEFRFGGEYVPRPENSDQEDDESWASYLYTRTNALGYQTEWWYHQSGCGLWFLADRHTKTQHVRETYRWERERASSGG